MNSIIKPLNIIGTTLLVALSLAGCSSPLNLTSENYKEYILGAEDFGAISPQGFTSKTVEEAPDFSIQGIEVPISDDCVLEEQTFSSANSSAFDARTDLISSGFVSKKSYYPNFFMVGQVITAFDAEEKASAYLKTYVDALKNPKCLSNFSNVKSGSISDRYKTGLTGFYIFSFDDSQHVAFIGAVNGRYVSIIEYLVFDEKTSNDLTYEKLDDVAAQVLRKFAG